MIEIRTLEGISFDRLYEAFSQAFADYDAPTITKEALAIMIERRGFSAEHSFGAFDGDRLVSFTFNGIGTHLGKATAYDTGTGTIKEYRGLKLAGRIFEESIPHLKNKRIEQYLLEVLQHNTPAFNIYKNQGFEISREFNYYFIDSKDIKPIEKTISKEYAIKEIKLPKLNDVSLFWDFQPSWQNSLDSINRRKEDFKATGCFKDNKLVGYGIIAPDSGDITQLAVDENHRKRGIASALMNELIKLSTYHSLKIINTEKEYLPMEHFIASLEIPLAGLQYEMIKAL